MIEFKTGDILEEDAEALVNTVNCEGYMGRGIALEFKRAYPENFKAYAAACRRQEVRPGRMFVFATGQLTNPRFIINFPTKRHWRARSRLEDIEAGLLALGHVIREHNIRSIAVPPLGSGLGGLSWRQVRPLIEEALLGLSNVRIVVFEPHATSGMAQSSKAIKPVPMTPGRAVLVGLIDRYLKGLMDPFVSLLEIHKLMYFMQAAGQPLRMRFVQGPYGPYAENLRHVLQALEGTYVTGYGSGGDAPSKLIQLLPGALEDAEDVIKSDQQLAARFERVTELVKGFESPYGLELLATVYWIVSNDDIHSGRELVRKVHSWARRKRQFTPQQIMTALTVLQDKGWLNVSHEISLPYETAGG